MIRGKLAYLNVHINTFMHIFTKGIEKAMYSFMTDRGGSQQFLVIQVHGPHLRNTVRVINRILVYLMFTQHDYFVR